MDDVNAAFARMYSFGISPQLMDVGASSGISTAEWRDDLICRGLQPRIIATDLMINGYLVKTAPQHFVLVDNANRVLQHELDGQILRPEEFTALAATVAMPDSSAPPVRRLANGLLRRYYRFAERRGWNRVRVKLISAAARALQFDEDDVLGPARPEFAERFDCLRIANLLNLGYFSRDDITRAVANMKLRLKGEGAILIVARTHPDGTNHASFCALDRMGRFQLLERLGRGSEIEDIVLSN